ncbi:MAG TPA: iron-containing alcohol dehydrogenase [Ruminiclostridium sp.]|nr:iron-containing alcohol dehydrogenase [Ruminiclostridium sp.]
MAYQFSLPGRIIIGENALQESMSFIQSYGTKALIVTGKIVEKTSAFKAVTGLLDNCNISYSIFSEITGEPTDKMIESGVKLYTETSSDFIIAIGGGSPLDSAKAIAAMTTLDGRISDYMGKEITGTLPPLVLIPTTSGTGSETTKFTIITDTQRNIKMLLKGDALLPQLAVIDYTFTMTAPQSITAATGMDALTHAVESYTSKKGNAMTNMYAIDAIKKIFKYLPKAYNNGYDKKAREEMAIASFEAGVCINNASVTLVHGMSRPIGALFHVPHGISNAMLITECLKYAMSGCYEKFAEMARVIGAADEKTGDIEAAKVFISQLEKLCCVLNIPTLAEYGIKKEDFDASVDKMADDAMASGSPANTIKSITKEDLLVIYQRLW